jgi:molybdenum ABC transporter molybdate-binding protein
MPGGGIGFRFPWEAANDRKTKSRGQTMKRIFVHAGFIAKPWFIAGGSLAVAAALALMLWQPVFHHGPKGELVLFCAAGILKPVEETAADYEKQYGTQVKIEPGGSGTLLSKIRVAPDRVDLFLAGEESYVREARAQHLVAEIIPYARQHPVIAVTKGNPHKIAAVDDLLAAGVTVAIPNPELAAVGKAVQQALAKGGQWDKLIQQSKQSGAKVSLVGTVTEAAQAVKIGAADAALVWDATARQFGIEFVEVPALQQQAEQATLGVIAATKHPTLALHFARFLTARDRGQLALAKHFFQPIADADLWADTPEITFMSGAMLKPAVDDLIKRFEDREGAKINTIYAGCGIHVAQMKAMKSGATMPTHFPDAYLSCDVSFMDMVQQWFEDSKRISRNDMVLAVAKGNPKNVRSLEDLTRLELRVGMAHPVNSALGKLADDLLKKLGLHDKVYSPDRKLPIVQADAAHMLVNQLRTGALDLILVYRSNVVSTKDNPDHAVEIVELNLPEAIAVQPYAVAKDSQHKYLMRRLLEAILTPESQKHFVASGFHWIAEGEAK